MEKKVSVIIPVYNAEKTLVRCLSNIVNQTLPGLEVIIIDDASTDQSMKIIEECQMQFSQMVKVIHSDRNRGAGGARNLGIDAAEGEYIGFVDSDDMIDITMYEKMYHKAIEGDYDIVDCGFYNEKEEEAVIYTSDALTGKLDSEKRKQLIVSGGYVWSKIFKAELLKNDTKCRFRENVILEDSDFITYIFAVAQNIGNVKEILYKYTYAQESLSHSVKSIKYIQNIYDAMVAIYNLASTVVEYESIKEAVEYEILQMYSYGVICCLSESLKNSNNMIDYMVLLREFRNKYVTAGYENRYVNDKIKSEDIEIMSLNDSSPYDLLKKYKKN